MRIYKKILTFFSAACLLVFNSSCNDQWDQHIEIADPEVASPITERLQHLNEVSAFQKLLVQTGLDKELSSSKSYTVFAPDNESIAGLDPLVLNDSLKLVQFLKNHIANSSFRTDQANDSLYVKMLSGKSLRLQRTTIDDVSITSADMLAGNGIIHVIKGRLDVKSNIWEYLGQSATSFQQAAFIRSLDTIHVYPNNILDTGNPNIDNEFINETYNVKDENKRFTLLLVDDVSFSAAADSMKRYTQRVSADTTRFLATHFTARDFVFSGEYRPDQLPDTLISKFGVKVPVSKNGLTKVPVSNGVIYKMTGLKLKMAHRILPLKIEGEKPLAFIPEKRSNTFYREKKDPSGVVFNDVMVQNHKTALFEIDYNSPYLYSTKYKVYWRAINDTQTNTFQQRLYVGGSKDANGTWTNTVAFPYTNVTVNNYSEVSIGDLTVNSSGTFRFALVGANNTTDGSNTVILDYIKLVPVLK